MTNKKVNTMKETKQRAKTGAKPDARRKAEAVIKLKSKRSVDPADRKAEGRSGAKLSEKQAVNPDQALKQEYIGIFEQIGAFGRVIPDDRREIREIMVLQGGEGGAKQGDRVAVELTPRGSYRNLLGRGKADAAGRVTEVLGAGGDLAVAEKALIRRLGLHGSFSEGQLAAADTLDRPVGPEECQGRLDLRQELLVTIDGDDTRDIDDAVSLKREGGKQILGVHIADVAHYVKEGSPLDKEAFARGTSVYFPDQVLPMLPPALSNGICSLNQGVDRLALSCLMTLNEQGAVTGYEIRPSVIRVRERLSYPQVQGYLNRHHWSTREALAGIGGAGEEAEEANPAREKPTGMQPAGTRPTETRPTGMQPTGMQPTGMQPLSDQAQPGDAEYPADKERRFFQDGTIGSMIIDMARLCLLLRKKRLDRGALDFDLPEGKITPGPDGKAFELKRKKRMLSEMIIEELMIAANETVAEHYRQLRVPFPYRIHDKPEQDRIRDLQKVLGSLGLSLKNKTPGDRKDKSRDKEGVKGAVTSGAYRQLLAEVRGKPEEALVSTLLLRSMNHASYGVENHGHFGLASPCYCHFTSPIRRYPDLMVHRMIRMMERDEERKPKWKEALQEKMEAQCLEASFRERIAEDAERKADGFWKADYMSRFVGQEFDGVISGVTDYGLYVGLENTAEGMIHISRLDGYYEYNEDKMSLISRQNPKRYRLGDPIRVLLESVDVGAGYINFSPADTQAGPTAKKTERENGRTALPGKGNKATGTTALPGKGNKDTAKTALPGKRDKAAGKTALPGERGKAAGITTKGSGAAKGNRNVGFLHHSF